MSTEEIEAVKDLDMNRSRFITIINDIFSWEMELKQSQSSSEEGSYLCSSIQIIMDSLGVDDDAAKAILWSIARHLEHRHLNLSSHLTEKYPRLEIYCKETGYHMSGIEAWHKETQRYRGSRRYQK
jgi:aristolochene synthase